MAEKNKETKVSTEKKTLVNCLMNRKVIVRSVNRRSSLVKTPNHFLSGGMADTAKRVFVAPVMKSSGNYKNILTDDEKEFLEDYMGMEPNALSVYTKKDNFWDDFSVTLFKGDNTLDLSDPMDYIKWKLLLSQTDYVAKSLKELEERPKETYMFVIIDEGEEVSEGLKHLDVKKRAYFNLGSIEGDRETMITVLELMDGKSVSPRITTDAVLNRLGELVEYDPGKFVRVTGDKLLNAKTLLRQALEFNLLKRRNGEYYRVDNNEPLCNAGGEATLPTAAAYIADPKQAELKFMLESKVQELKEK